MRHVNIPVFIPHLGCPNLCVFCNQKSISGKRDCSEDTIVADAEATISEALKTVDETDEVEIAFFGGSFTGIKRELMISLLELAKKYCDSGKVGYIRMSTRPDYISREILDILKCYPVKYIEIGVQSMSDDVLIASKRGHTAEQTRQACRLINEYGFSLVGQMMTGLPCSTPEKELDTAREIIKMGAVAARIYPTMIFRHTELEKMVLNGEYSSPSVESTVSRAAAVYEEFERNGVRVIKIGLHSGEALGGEDGITISEYHPAMGELIYGRVMLNRMKALIEQNGITGDCTFIVGRGMTSKALGHKCCNREELKKLYSANIKIIESDAVHGTAVGLG